MTNEYMNRALELARLSQGETSPNPPVGAVVVRDGRIVGEGRTRPAGQSHAEVVALRQAAELARGATLYVTLEPCAHHGRTPPCANAVVSAGIAEVHASIQDPNPQVAGRGLERLRQAGISVSVGLGSEQAEELAAPHAKFITTGTPLVTLKFAMSLDGKIATRTGDSKWITSEAARRRVHELRARSDSIMAGIGTVIADDPMLTARGQDGAPLSSQPLRVIVDSRARISPGAALLRQPGDTLIAVARASDEDRARLESDSVVLFAAPAPDGRVDLPALMAELGRRRITSLFVEGGGTLAGSLLDAGLVDRLVAFIAPVIIGGEDAPSPIRGKGAQKMADAIRLGEVQIDRFGPDLAITAKL